MDHTNYSISSQDYEVFSNNSLIMEENIHTFLVINSMGLINVDKNVIMDKYNLLKKSEMSITESYTLLLEICDDMMLLEQDYDKLGVRILFKITELNNIAKGVMTFTQRQNYINDHLPNFMNCQYITFINKHQSIIDQIYNDYSNIPEYLTMFGYKTLLGAYTITVNKVSIENPLDVFLRCAIGLYFLDVSRFLTDDSSVEVLNNIRINMKYMHGGNFTHATPTLFNAGTINNQLSSCFLIGMDDSINAIYENLYHCAQISQKCGGIGFSVSNVRASGSRIKSSNGEASGLVTMLRPYNTTAYYVNQGGKGSKRSGAFAAFLEPWHADIVEFIQSRLQNGDEYNLLRDLFIGLWIPDLFMKQFEIDGDWYLMCPDECPGLYDLYGDEFEKQYWKYVSEGKYRSVMKAHELMFIIRKTITESGQPYMMFKDNVNRRSNQSNIGTIRSSNLCCEITEVSGFRKHSVCNLASISVNRFINETKTDIDHEKLLMISRLITRNLNNCIDYNSYPTEYAKQMNLLTRPIGIGIQGVANLLMDLRIPYESERALEIEASFMETIYYGALFESNNLAKKYGHYDKFPGSPYSIGLFQFDMIPDFDYSKLRYDWNSLRRSITEFGTRNSLVTALMPTASTSQILGNVECFEPVSSNCYVRKTSSGSFKCINYNLINDLKELGLWNEEMKNKLVEQKGSVQNIDYIPQYIKDLYKTVWEIKQKWIMDHAIARSPFVDQSQSMNLYFDVVTKKKFDSAMVYAWKHGLKTGSYYTRTQAAHDATDKAKTSVPGNMTNIIHTKNSEDIDCVNCSA